MLRAGVIFCMTNTQFKKERKGIERKKIKVILGQTTLNHYINTTQREKEC